MKAFILAAITVLSTQALAFDIRSDNLFGMYSESTTQGLQITLRLPLATTVGPFSTLNHNYKEIIVQAQEDAAIYVATNGEIRTNRLELAFQVIYANLPDLEASDMEIAYEIAALPTN